MNSKTNEITTFNRAPSASRPLRAISLMFLFPRSAAPPVCSRRDLLLTGCDAPLLASGTVPGLLPCYSITERFWTYLRSGTAVVLRGGALHVEYPGLHDRYDLDVVRDPARAEAAAERLSLMPVVQVHTLSEGSVAANVLKHGTGGLNIDGCRVAVADGTERWPANIIHDGSDAVISSFSSPAIAATPRGQRRRTRHSHPTPSSGMDATVAPNNAINPARFFYCAKASPSDRGSGNHHPTVKPNNLMRYLVRLVTPPGGTVLDPFLGSGSTGKAALAEGFGIVGCEVVPEYVQISRSRISPIEQSQKQI